MKRTSVTCGALALFFLLCAAAEAHFGMIIPSDSMVTQNESRKIGLQISFSHPFEMVGMDMARPNVFGVYTNDKIQDLLTGLKPAEVLGAAGWRTDYAVNRPGAYLFFVEPAPYWEPAEDVFIVHHTKTVIAAFGDDDGWDAELGHRTEIVPLSRPFGLYAGNVFQGVVKMNGKPVPHAKVEVEYYNRSKTVAAPSDYMISQTVKADRNGVFTYAAPWAGWWGFAALNTADFKLIHEGEYKDVELGAVIWVLFHEIQ